MAADSPPPPPADADRGAAEQAGRTKTKHRTRVGRFRINNPRPAVIVLRPGTPEAQAPPRRERPPHRFPGLDGALAVLILTLGGFLASFAAVNSDLWTHLAAGRLVAHGQFPFGTDPFCAAAGATWINHAWLFDLFMYLLYQPGGAALVAAKAGIVVALSAVLLGFRRHVNAGFGPAAVTVLVLLAVSPFFVLRSSVASYLLFAVLLLVLHRFGEDRQTRGFQWKLPLAVGILFVLWVNLDGGFVFGLVLLAAWAIGSFLQHFLPLGDAANDLGESGQSPRVVAAALGAAMVGSLLSPYHVRSFALPEELAPLTAPSEFWRDEYFRNFFQGQFYISLFERDDVNQFGQLTKAGYMTQAGVVPAAAMYALLALGLLSFAVNVGGWRWRRALAWAVFAWLGVSHARLAPYFAIVAGPAIVLNFQAWLAARRMARGKRVDRRARRLRIQIAGVGRIVLATWLVILLAVAWPGWLGPDVRSLAPPRRVAWRAVADPTNERLARRLKTWYDADELKQGQARGFHYPPSVTSYCAWFCPSEKGVFDLRLTAPREAVAEYLAIAKAFSLGRSASTDPAERLEPPDSLLKTAGMSHVVISGPSALKSPPDLGGFGLMFFTEAARFPAWAIEGRGVIVGIGDDYPRLRLDPIGRAIGAEVEPLPEPPTLPTEVAPTTMWDRYVAAPPPMPPETYEAGLWLAYREATVYHARLLAFPAWGGVSGLVRYAPLGPPVIGAALVNVSAGLDAAWRRSAEGRAGRAAALLAERAARRSIRINPSDPDPYFRLVQTYSALDLDPLVGPFQKITAARQAIGRLKAATYRPSPLQEEAVLQGQLYEMYSQMVVPGTQVQPLDLMREALSRFVELRERLGVTTSDNGDPKQFEANLQREQAGLEQLQAKVSENRNNWELRPKDVSPAQRAAEACRYGLPREALNVLTTADAKQLDPGAIIFTANLLLLAGETESARELLGNIRTAPEIVRATLEFRLHLQTLTVDAAVSLGDYRTGIEQCDDVLELLDSPAQLAAARLVAHLIAPGGSQPLAQVVTFPFWGGVMIRGQQPLAGDLVQAVGIVRQQNDWLVRQGVIALEAGDIPLARRRLGEMAASRLPFGNRPLAQRWTELWSPPR
jgi:hypothetical protein